MRYVLETKDKLTQDQGFAILQAIGPGTLLREEKAPLKRLQIIGRRWFQKSAGNTYHTAEVWIDGEMVYHSPRQYGYGSQFLQTAISWLYSSGTIPAEADPFTFRDKWEALGYDFSYCVSEVSRERDL